jgi:hypothetical protein
MDLNYDNIMNNFKDKAQIEDSYSIKKDSFSINMISYHKKMK